MRPFRLRAPRSLLDARLLAMWLFWSAQEVAFTAERFAHPKFRSGVDSDATPGPLTLGRGRAMPEDGAKNAWRWARGRHGEAR
jgi:hypothetical protein